MRINPPFLRGLMRWVEEVNSRASFSDVELVVEGVNDERALRELGVVANFTYVSYLLRDIRELGEIRIRGRTFIVMTDFDREGRLLHDRLKRMVTELGGKIDEAPRKAYKSLGMPPLIEELSGFLRRRVKDWSLLRRSSP